MEAHIERHKRNANALAAGLEAMGLTLHADERYLLSGNNNPGVGAISGTYSTPRMWFAGVKVRSR